MRHGILVAGVLVVVATAGCAGFLADGGANDPGTPTTAAPSGTDHPLRGVAFWVGGELVDVDGSAIVLDTGGRRIVLNTTHAVLFESAGGQQEWTSVDTWTDEETGVNVCLSAHVHEDGDAHVIKAFYDSTCTPLAQSREKGLWPHRQPPGVPNRLP